MSGRGVEEISGKERSLEGEGEGEDNNRHV